MIRLLGAMTGSALAVATLLVLVGVPQFRSGTGDVEEPARTPVTLPRPVTPVETSPAMPVADAGGPAAETPPSRGPAPAGPPEAAAPADAPVADIADDVRAIPAAADEPEVQQWYAFWSPFRSEIAAAGFVSRLQSVTGLDYRVVRRKHGVYEVAFAYDDDDEIIDNLAQISAATGLELAENR